MAQQVPTYNVLRSLLVKDLLRVDGKPIDFDNYMYQEEIYDCSHSSILLKTGRQVGKSTQGACFIVGETIALPFFKTLFVAPTKEQTSRFSVTKLGKIIQYSPAIKKYFVGGTDNVLLKLLKNGGEIILNYARDDADRVRGPSADRIFLDEIQDMLLDAIFPVIRETMANSDYQYLLQAGTPKSLENSIEWLWSRSTQTEWVVKCEACSSHNIFVSEKNIGKKGPICLKCGGYLRPRDGFWYDMNPSTEANPIRTKGYHVSQLILPKNSDSQQRWDSILDKYENYAPHEFKNEVLGVSDALGTRLISKQELEALCEDYTVEPTPNPANRKGCSIVCAGVDWSGGGTQITSRTAIWVFGWHSKSKKLKTLYFKIFPGRSQVEDLDEVISICKKYDVQHIFGDAGEGALANSFLRERLGAHRALQVMYSGSLGKFIKWSEDRYVVNRTAAIDSFMITLKQKGVIFPNLKQMGKPIEDILAEYEEVTQGGQGKKVWRHSPSVPDDCLHAMIFAQLAVRFALGEVIFYDATKDELSTAG